MTLICFSFCSWHRKHFFVSEVPFTQLTSYIIYCFYNSVQPFRCLQDVTCSWALLSLVYKKRNRASRSQHRDFLCHRTNEWKILILVFQIPTFYSHSFCTLGPHRVRRPLCPAPFMEQSHSGYTVLFHKIRS